MKNIKVFIVYMFVIMLLTIGFMNAMLQAKIDEKEVQIHKLEKEIELKENTIDNLNQQLGVYSD